MLNILVCAPSALSSLPFNSFFSLNIFEGFLCWKVYVQIYQTTCNKNLLLAECEVRTASYGPSFFPSFYGPSAKREGHENKEGKNEDP